MYTKLSDRWLPVASADAGKLFGRRLSSRLSFYSARLGITTLSLNRSFVPGSYQDRRMSRLHNQDGERMVGG
jgi:hypothetical protein